MMWGNQVMWGDGWGGIGWAWFGLMHVFWWVLVIAGIVALVRWLVGGRNRHQANESRALDILRERFARREIDKDEYEERRRILKG